MIKQKDAAEMLGQKLCHAPKLWSGSKAEKYSQNSVMSLVGSTIDIL